MKKLLCLILFYSSICFGVEFTWLGTTAIILKSDKKTLMFDPYITHPNILVAALFKKIDSDKSIVDKWLKLASVKEINYVIVTHSHYDHILDLGTVMKKYPKSIGFGSPSSKNFALGQEIPSERFKVVGHEKKYSIDQVKIKTIKVAHGTHVLGYTFMDGAIEKPLKLPASVWDLKQGDSFIYQFSGEFGNIVFHPTGAKSPYFNDYTKLKTDVLFIGIAKRGSTERQIKEIISKIQPKVVIPIHFDNFFFELKKSPSDLPGINLEEWKKTMKEKYPSAKVIIPKVSEWIKIPE